VNTRMDVDHLHVMIGPCFAVSIRRIAVDVDDASKLTIGAAFVGHSVLRSGITFQVLLRRCPLAHVAALEFHVPSLTNPLAAGLGQPDSCQLALLGC
jgi:hypothetical protein